MLFTYAVFFLIFQMRWLISLLYFIFILGLHLILNVNQEEYVDSMGDTAGARVVIHHQSRMPHPEDDGITLVPGALTSIGIRHVGLLICF